MSEALVTYTLSSVMPLLTPEAHQLCRTPVTELSPRLYRCGGCDEEWLVSEDREEPWMPSRAQQHSAIHAEHPLLVRRSVVFFSKTVREDTSAASDHGVARKYTEAMADVINRLTAAKMIGTGCLCQPMAVPLVSLDDTHRLALIFAPMVGPKIDVGPISPPEAGQLNAFLKNGAFVREGEVGDEDWTNLLKVSQ